MLLVKQFKSAGMILFSDLYQEYNKDQLFSLPNRVRESWTTHAVGKYDDFAQIIRLKEVAGGRGGKWEQNGEQPRKISGLYARPALPAQEGGWTFSSALLDKVPREILRTKGIRASLSPTDNRSK